MEINFKKVHTGMDLAISSLIFISGAALFFVNKGLGVCMAVCGLLAFFLYKGGFKKDGEGPILSRKSEDLCKSCRSSLLNYLNGKGTDPEVKKGTDGGCIRLDIYFNQGESIAYAQLYDFRNYTYEPATGMVELKGDKAEKLISKL